MTWWAARLPCTTMSPGAGTGTRDRWTSARKALPVRGPSGTSGAVMPPWRRQANKVMIVPCPCGSTSVTVSSRNRGSARFRPGQLRLDVGQDHVRRTRHHPPQHGPLGQQGSNADHHRTGQKPGLAQTVLTVRRTRCISQIAVDGSTGHRAVAWRALLPAALDRTIRSRKSPDRGAAIATSTTLDPTSPMTCTRRGPTGGCSQLPTGEWPLAAAQERADRAFRSVGDLRGRYRPAGWRSRSAAGCFVRPSLRHGFTRHVRSR